MAKITKNGEEKEDACGEPQRLSWPATAGGSFVLLDLNDMWNMNRFGLKVQQVVTLSAFTNCLLRRSLKETTQRVDLIFKKVKF